MSREKGKHGLQPYEVSSNLIWSITGRGSKQYKETAIGKAMRFHEHAEAPTATASTLQLKSQSFDVVRYDVIFPAASRSLSASLANCIATLLPDRQSKRSL